MRRAIHIQFTQSLLIGAGLAAMGFGVFADQMGLGSPGVGWGEKQTSACLSGLVLLATGLALSLSRKVREVGEWALVLLSAIIVAFAADLFAVAGLGSFTVKHVAVAAAVLGALVLRARNHGQPSLTAVNWREFQGIIGIGTQLFLIVLVVRQYQLGDQAFHYNIVLVVLYGWLLHYLLAHRYQLPFFLFLSLATVFGLFGLESGLWLVLLGMGLIAICHIPIRLSIRIILLLTSGVLLALLRINWLEAPWSSAIWPVFGSMFMFRLIIYMYDLQHQKEGASLSTVLSYFFMFPNLVFPFFPIVDYSTFRRTYCDSDRLETCHKGARWIFRGIIHLLLYRLVNHYVVIAPQEVVSLGGVLRFVIASFLLYLRVSGLFHLIIGILQLFGFNLPETHRHYYLSSSFTDLWRRINIYWKDFMLKLFFLPSHFRLRALGPTPALVLSTLIVFVITWFFHSYQWFWLRGTWLLAWHDVLFWAVLASLVLTNTLWEDRFGRKRSLRGSLLPRESFWLAVRTAATFSVMCLLWSLWSSTSVAEWLSVFGVVEWSWIPGFFASFMVMVGVLWIGRRVTEHGAFVPRSMNRAAVWSVAGLVAVYAIGDPMFYREIGGSTSVVLAQLTSSGLSERDAARLQQGYYENLLAVGNFNSELLDVHAKRPTQWPLIYETEVARLTQDFRFIELVASKSILFHGAQFSTNMWGMRDRDYQRLPGPTTFRIALLGPSIIMGSGVADEDVFDNLLEDLLTERYPGSQKFNFEILNFGVSGYSALQELFVFENKALEFGPDAVLYMAHQLEEDLTIRNLATAALSLDVTGNAVEGGVSIPYKRLRETVAEAGIEVGMSLAEAQRRLEPFGERLVAWSYRRLADLARENQILPIWVFIPALDFSVGQDDKAKLIQLAQEAGFVTLDLSEVYSGWEVASLVVAAWDKHPNQKGHRLLAEGLLKSLTQNGMVPLDAFSDWYHSSALGATQPNNWQTGGDSASP